MMQSNATRAGTRKRSGNGKQDIKFVPPSSLLPPSTSFVPPLSSSNRPWLRPTSVRELSAQVTDVATLLLNGKIDLEQARVYSALIRGIAQMVSIEVAKARLSKTLPDLKI